MSARNSARNVQGNVFNRLEKFLKNKYPQFIKNILISCGFESEASLKTINEQSIELIENYVNRKKELLEGTNYINEDGSLTSDPFKFLIGHKLLLLSIPQTIVEYTSEKRNKKKNLPTTVINPETVTSSLLTRFQNYQKTNFLKNPITIDHLKEFTLNENRAKVLVKCIQCDLEVPCTFNKNWSISNYIKHVRTHDSKTSQELGLESSNIQPFIQRAGKLSSQNVLSTVFR